VNRLAYRENFLFNRHIRACGKVVTTVTTVGAVRDIEAKIYKRIEEIASGGVTSTLTPVDGSLIIKDNTIDIGISAEPGNALTKKADGLYVGTSTSGNYAAGSGLTLVDGTFSVKLADETHGLVAVDGALALNLATQTSDGAMSKEDKIFLDALRELNISSEYATKDEVQSIRDSVTQIEQGYSWQEM
jgi:hypothetical protein